MTKDGTAIAPRKLGVLATSALVVGNMVGSGVYLLPASLAAYGGVSLFGGRGTAPGALGGLLLITVIHNAMNLAQIEANYVKVVSGGVIALAVLVDALRARRRE